MLDNNTNINNIKTTMAVEGMFIDDRDTQLINQYLNNQITEQEGVDKIRNDILSRMV